MGEKEKNLYRAPAAAPRAPVLAQHLLAFKAVRRTLLKTGIKNAFLRSVSTPEDRSKAPNFCVWDALEIIILITGVLFAMRYLVR